MKNSLTLQCTWHPEYASYMIEGTPSNAFGGYGEDLVRVETNMLMRRGRINQALKKDEVRIGIGSNSIPPPVIFISRL